MSRFLIRPNLPENETVLAAAGEKYCHKIEKALERQGIELVSVPPDAALDPRLCCHADLSLLHAGYEKLFISKNLCESSVAVKLREYGFFVTITDCDAGNKYPDDCHINVCIADKSFICVRNIIAGNVKDFLIKKGLNPIYVNQGYAKCCICILDERSVITSDKGIALSLNKAGFDVLLINPGGIILDGFDYGFIGGSAFLSSKDRICFTGDFRYLGTETERKIMDFLELKGINHNFLTDGPMFDMGGIIQLKEKES